MSAYTPLFQKIVFSSLWSEEDFVVKVFLTMLAKQDADHVVRGCAYEIGQWARKTEAEALDALAILAAPDTKRIEAQPFDGRRIEKVEDGWLVLNGAMYQKLMQDVNRRAYQRRWMADKRKRVKSDPAPLDDNTDTFGESQAKKPEYQTPPVPPESDQPLPEPPEDLPGEF